MVVLLVYIPLGQGHLSRIEDLINRDKLCFSDEAKFHVSGTVNRHNYRVWGSENSHDVTV
jgi:hypothetical protein